MVLTVNGLKVTFGGDKPFTAVDHISFTIDRGKTLAIVGESGSGKSLTALSLMGLLPKTAIVSGELLLHMRNATISLTDAAVNKVRGKDIGMVFQEPMSALNPVMSVGKQLKESILIHQKLNDKEGKELAIAWLGKVQFPEPEKIYGRFPHQLSGGQKQRVMIAMAMCNHPALLIADEPVTALDATIQQEIIRLMSFLQQEHQSAMIFITHDLALAATIADEVLVMYKGEMIEYGTTEQVLANPKHPYTKALIACRPSPEQKGHRLPIVADFLNADKTLSTVHITEQQQHQVSHEHSGHTLLSVNKLNVWFPESRNISGNVSTYFKAVKDVSFTIKKGEVMGLVGESGCGKSTLSRALAGLLPLHDGSIIFNDKELSAIPLRQWKEVRKDIQMIFQDPYTSLNPRMTIGDTLMEPLSIHNIVARYELQKEALRLLDLVQLPAASLQRYPHQFSGGQRQRIGIARALALRPQLLICDESVSALDVSIQAQILNLLRDLQAEFQLTYLFISHDLAVVHYISDRIMVMQAGSIIESGEARQVITSPKEAYTQRLIAAMPGVI